MSGSPMSPTTASCGAWKMRAFMVLLGSCRDQLLHVLRRPGGEPLEGRFGLVHGETAGDDALDGEAPGRNLCRHPRPVVDAVAPAPDDLEGVERPQHRVDLTPLHVQPDLDDRAAALDRLDAGTEGIAEAGTFDGDVDTQSVGALPELSGNVHRLRV